jgi:CBS domain-containing protein
MTAPVIYVKPGATLEEVAGLLSKHHISGIPVVNDDIKVVGIISETDIVKYSQQLKVIPLTNSFGWVSPYREITDIAAFHKGFELLSRTRVENVMSKNIVTVGENVPTSEVAQLMNKRNINRIPVVNADNKLLGIITRADLIRYIAEGKS